MAPALVVRALRARRPPRAASRPTHAKLGIKIARSA